MENLPSGIAGLASQILFCNLKTRRWARLRPDSSACGCCFLRSTRPILSPSPVPIDTEPRYPPSRGMKVSGLSPGRPPRLSIWWVSASCRCAVRAPAALCGLPGRVCDTRPRRCRLAPAARAYINPLAAQMMLTRYPPRGKRVLLTAAGSDCAILLGQWARQAGAEAVYGIHRSAVHAERLEAMGITPVAQHDANRIGTVAARSDIVYDATGGPLAEAILSVMPEPGMFVCYGLLSGQAFTQRRPAPRVAWFHIRNGLDALSVEAWRAEFDRIWLRLPDSQYSDVTVYPLAEWRRALSAYREGGRTRKPLLSMAE